MDNISKIKAYNKLMRIIKPNTAYQFSYLSDEQKQILFTPFMLKKLMNA